jgi:membrane-associated protease RseP (regulator of RpoE activity)
MKHRRPPRWPRCLAISLLLVLAACRSGGTPTIDPGTPTFLRPSPGRPTILGTVAVPRATPAPIATPTGADLTPAEATLLVDQAVGLLLDYSLDHPASADLYQAAYDGAILALARSGLLVDRALLPFSGERGDDAPIFRATYRALADEAGSRGGQRALAYAAIRAAIERTDQCQTYFLEPGALEPERTGQPADAGYGGIGVTLRGQGSPLAIEAVYADSPAALAGLRPDDRILAVDGTAATTLDAAALAERLRGAVGTTLQLTILRPGEAVPRTVTVVRAPVRQPPFTTALLAVANGQTVAYLQLAQITAPTIPALREAIAELGRVNPQGWVLDLRGSAVGPVELLPDLGGLFIPSGQLLGYVVVDAGESPIVANGELSGSLGPIAVLTDSGTRGGTAVDDGPLTVGSASVRRCVSTLH